MRKIEVQVHNARHVAWMHFAEEQATDIVSGLDPHQQLAELRNRITDAIYSMGAVSGDPDEGQRILTFGSDAAYAVAAQAADLLLAQVQRQGNVRAVLEGLVAESIGGDTDPACPTAKPGHHDRCPVMKLASYSEAFEVHHEPGSAEALRLQHEPGADCIKAGVAMLMRGDSSTLD